MATENHVEDLNVTPGATGDAASVFAENPPAQKIGSRRNSGAEEAFGTPSAPSTPTRKTKTPSTPMPGFAESAFGKTLAQQHDQLVNGMREFVNTRRRVGASGQTTPKVGMTVAEIVSPQRQNAQQGPSAIDVVNGVMGGIGIKVNPATSAFGSVDDSIGRYAKTISAAKAPSYANGDGIEGEQLSAKIGDGSVTAYLGNSFKNAESVMNAAKTADENYNWMKDNGYLADVEM